MNAQPGYSLVLSTEEKVPMTCPCLVCEFAHQSLQMFNNQHANFSWLYNLNPICPFNIDSMTDAKIHIDSYDSSFFSD